MSFDAEDFVWSGSLVEALQEETEKEEHESLPLKIVEFHAEKNLATAVLRNCDYTKEARVEYSAFHKLFKEPKVLRKFAIFKKPLRIEIAVIEHIAKKIKPKSFTLAPNHEKELVIETREELTPGRTYILVLGRIIKKKPTLIGTACWIKVNQYGGLENQIIMSLNRLVDAIEIIKLEFSRRSRRRLAMEY